MRSFLFAAAVAAISTGCSKSNDAEKEVRFVAAGLQAIAPKDMGHDVILESAKADGKTLVLAFRGIGGSNAAAVSAGFKQYACNDSNYRNLFDRGGAIRLEMSSYDGTESPPVTVDSCNA